ncbi:MAG: hypothetical protein QGD90_13100, partial [Candidatus Hydrogenedentes bacterium]|nr:hypothetical protein [Candidatus Hydrogenedentota bacterium]
DNVVWAVSINAGVMGVCQMNLSQAAETQSESRLRSRHHGFPFSHRLVAEYPECATGNEMALDVEQIADRAVNREESLR